VEMVVSESVPRSRRRTFSQMSLTEFKKEAPLFSFLVRKGKKIAGQLFIITEKADNGNTYSNNKQRFLIVPFPCMGEF